MLPKIACKGECYGCCGPITMTRHEADRIQDRTGKSPEYILDDITGVKTTRDLLCPLLDKQQRCSVYEDRPLICRAWGVLPNLACEFGCKPDRVMTQAEEEEMWRRYRALKPDVHTASLRWMAAFLDLKTFINAEVARRGG